MAVGSISFSQQVQSWRAGQASANARFSGGGDLATETDVAMNRVAAAASMLANTAIVFHRNAAVLATQAGIDLILRTAQEAAGPSSTADKIRDQVSFGGTIAGLVDFGEEGRSVIGGYQLVKGSALKFAFSVAMNGLKSHGEWIDTASVRGHTLTASTSGSDAHDVFTLTLQPESGIWTFTLVNPIDLPTDVYYPTVTLDLSTLMQGVKSNGQTVALPHQLKVTVDPERTDASGTARAGTVHQGGLAYTAPSTAPVDTPYQPPINPLTGYRYVATSSAAQAIGATVNLFA